MSRWYENTVFYHMYPLGMVGAEKINSASVESHGFSGLERWIPHIKELGCGAVYIGPLFQSMSHGYDTKDYSHVDYRLGSDEGFKSFVEECHKSGIKVVVDGVFNHTGREFPAFQDIRKNRENSRYRDWYQNVDFYGNTHFNDGFSYGAWRNYYELPALNLRNQEVREYLYDIIRGWIRNFNIDGIRFDCADCLDFEFIKETRRITSQEKQDFWLMGEVIHGDYSRWANGEMMHSVTNYELYKGLYSGHNDFNYFEIAHTVKRQSDENGGIYRHISLYNFVDNHDVDRIASTLNEKRHILPVHILLYTLPGVPSIYYGGEWRIEGRKINGSDDGLRPALDLEEMTSAFGRDDFLETIKRLGKIRKENLVFAEGNYKELCLTNRQYAFARISADAAAVVAVNNDTNRSHMRIPVPVACTEAAELLSGKTVKLESGFLEIELEASSGMIFKLL